MPADMSKYPDNWAEIREQILTRAGGDITGDIRKGASCEWCGAENHKPHPITGSVVVLTIAHLDDPNPMNCDANNLAALCQKCHNSYDAPMRAQNRKKRERKEQIENGQMTLFMEIMDK
jgi:5-methylcytosine-specific restriction endonuclease McrA